MDLRAAADEATATNKAAVAVGDDLVVMPLDQCQRLTRAAAHRRLADIG